MVMSGEGGMLLHFVLVFLLTGAGLALGRGAAHALFLKRYGIENLPFMYLVLGALMFVVCTLYAAFSDRLSSERMFYRLFLTLAVLVTCNWALMTFTDTPAAYPLFFLLFEVVSEILLAHAALYIGQNLDIQQNKRLSPMIFAGIQVGTIAGGLCLVVAAQWFDVEHMLLLWTFLILATLPVLAHYHRKRGASPYFRHSRHSQARVKQSIDQIAQGFSFMRHNRLLRLISMALFFMVISFYVLIYAVNKVYTQAFTTEADLTAFFGLLTAVTSAVALMTQIFFTNKLIWRFGIKKINLIYPFTTLAAFFGLLGSFTFPLAFFASINKDAIMPAIRMPVRNLFFNALPGYMQGRARAMSLAIVLPLSLATTGVLLIMTTRIDNPVLFLSIGVAATLMYIYFSLGMNRAYVAGIVTALRENVYLPEQGSLRVDTKDKLVRDEIRRGLSHEDDEISLAYARILVNNEPQAAAETIFPRFLSAGNVPADQIIKLLSESSPAGFEDFLISRMEKGDPHLRATCVAELVNLGSSRIIPAVRECLESENPRLHFAGLYGSLKLDDAPHAKFAYQEWKRLFASDNPFNNIIALDMLSLVPDEEFGPELQRLLRHGHSRVVAAVLRVLKQWPNRIDHYADQMIEHLSNEDSNVRLLVIQCAARLPENYRRIFAMQGLEDDHPLVRDEAVRVMFQGDAEASNRIEEMLIKNHVSPRAQMSLLKELLRKEPPQFMIEGLIREKVRDAQALQAARYTLGRLQHDEAVKLLDYVLEERLQQVVDLVLVAMQNLEGEEAVAIVRSGLKSGDARLIANAMEVLSHVSNRTLAGQINNIIEIVSAKGGVAGREQPGPDSFHDIFEWCRSRRDPWLNDCAAYVQGRLGWQEP